MKSAISIVRATYVAGRHIHNCFAEEAKRREGWRQMQAAKRWCRKLGWRPEAVLP